MSSHHLIPPAVSFHVPGPSPLKKLNGSTNSAGVGVLVSDALLSHLEHPPTRTLECVVPGRIGVLRLQGRNGGIDLFTVYFTTGDAPSDRAAQRRALAAALQPRTGALSIIGGDFNYTSMDEDRANLQSGQWSGGRQTAEDKEFVSLVSEPHQLVELEQPDFTHRTTTGMSRLDRIYVNMPASHQLDHTIQCAALKWPAYHISAHRPVSFSIHPPKCKTDAVSAIPADIVRHPDWHHRVVALHQHWMRQEGSSHEVTGVRELVLLKRAMREVGQTMIQERSRQPEKPPQGPQDELTRIMRFLRAVDQGRFHRARALTSGVGRLQPFASIRSRGEALLEQQLIVLREAAMDLAKEVVLEELREQQSQAPDQPESVQKARRSQIMTKIRRLKPGSCTTLRCMRTEAGEIITEPDAILSELRRHWGRVFTARPRDAECIEAWLRSSYPQGDGLENFPGMDDPGWPVGKKDIAKAVRLSGHSAPGPDGLPYEAWKRMKDYGVETLWAAMQDLSKEQSGDLLEEAYRDEADCNFNLGLLCCLPKKADGTTDTGLPIFTADSTRPLSIVDTANRLLANAARLRWEGMLERWLSPNQRGFLPMRSMLANILDIEEAAMGTSVSQQEGAIILFDFAAAFPSISQEFLLHTLEFIGFPRHALHLIRAVYHKSACILRLAGHTLDGFSMTAGVRQGCPLSPLLYVVAMDGLLRRVHREIPSAVTRAYADDTAMVVQSIQADTRVAQDIFTELEAVSCLRLNLKKCVLIPLGDRTHHAVRASLSEWCPAWTAMHIADCGKYLGMVIGPGKGFSSWRDPIQKAWSRVHMWDWSKLGLLFATQVWNVFIISTLSFVAQLERPPPDVLANVESMLRKAAYGPGNWCSAADMQHLQRSYCFASEFKSLATVVPATMLRVACMEDRWNGGLRVCDRSRSLTGLVQGFVRFGRYGRMYDWHRLASVHQLADNLLHLQQRGVTERAIVSQLTSHAVRPWTQDMERRVRRNFQRAVHQAIKSQTLHCAEQRVSEKLSKFGIMDRRQADRSLRRLRWLSGRVPPRVWAATFGSLWNRWATWRRRQRRCRACVLCDDAEDSIQHYAVCRVVRRLGRERLGLQHRYCPPLESWLLAAPQHRDADADPHWWDKLAVLQYAVLRTTNGLRAAGSCRGQMDPTRALSQALIEAVRDSPTLARVVLASR